MITLEQFWMTRDRAYASELTDAIRRDAAETVRRANALIASFVRANPANTAVRGVASGWRPSAVNAATPGAAKKSNHMLGRALDITDRDGALDAWLITLSGQAALTQIGLWIEHPSATPNWSHVQIIPPASGNRVFKP